MGALTVYFVFFKFKPLVVSFSGTHCETDIDDCQMHSCQNDHTCIDSINAFVCECGSAYTGTYQANLLFCEATHDICI